MRAEELFDQWLENAVQRDKQVDARGVHLTVAEVLTGHLRGRVDFGGSELEPAATHPLEPGERTPRDRLPWWRLDAGAYVVRFNERLKQGAPPMLLVASERLLSAGCTVGPTVCGAGEIRTVLAVPSWGVSIKQNARIALLRPFA